MTEPRFVMLHSEFESRNPDVLAIERAYAAQRTARGLGPLRDFPCPGSLQAVGDEAGMLVVVCSRCRYETTVRADRLPGEGTPF